MAQPQTKHLTVPQPSQSTALARLHSDLFLVTRQLAELNTASAKLREAAKAEAAIIHEIGELGKTEISAMTAWAESGCAGSQPEPDQKQRRILSEELAAAHAATVAAQGAGKDIDAQIKALTEQQAMIRSRIEAAALDVVKVEFDELLHEHLVETKRYRKLTARIAGLNNYLSQHGRNLIDRGERQSGMMYLHRAGALNGNLPNPGINQQEIIEAANDWSVQIASLRGEQKP